MVVDIIAILRHRCILSSPSSKRLLTICRILNLLQLLLLMVLSILILSCLLRTSLHLERKRRLLTLLISWGHLLRKPIVFCVCRLLAHISSHLLILLQLLHHFLRILRNLIRYLTSL